MTFTATPWYSLPSNYSNGTSVSGIGSFMQYNNDVLSGWFGIMILIAIYSITFLSLKNQSFEKAFVAASFISFAFSVLLMRIAMVSPSLVIGLLLMTVIGSLLVRNESQRGL